MAYRSPVVGIIPTVHMLSFMCTGHIVVICPISYLGTPFSHILNIGHLHSVLNGVLIRGSGPQRLQPSCSGWIGFIYD